jgi:hypothetical protein
MAMFLAIAVILLALWALGFFVFPAEGVLVHILLVLAIISLIWHFLAGHNSHA